MDDGVTCHTQWFTPKDTSRRFWVRMHERDGVVAQDSSTSHLLRRSDRDRELDLWHTGQGRGGTPLRRDPYYGLFVIEELRIEFRKTGLVLSTLRRGLGSRRKDQFSYFVKRNSFKITFILNSKTPLCTVTLDKTFRRKSRILKNFPLVDKMYHTAKRRYIIRPYYNV